MNVPELDYVIHYGISSSLDDFMQESGRAGREGQRCYSIVLYHSHSLKGSVISEEAKKFLKTDRCRRKVLLELVGEQCSVNSGKPECCDICDPQCLAKSEVERLLG